MRKLRMLPFAFLLLLLLPVPCFAVTIDEVATMAGEGVSSEVILALINATDSVFDLSADEVVMLKEAGVGDDVILAMIGGGKSKEEVKEVGDVYLKLDEDQFRRLYLSGEQDLSAPEVDTQPRRQASYYEAPPALYGRGYISHPATGGSSYSSGLTRTTYNYVYPGGYEYDRKYYQPVYYPYQYSNPRYYIYDGSVYYPDNYYPGYYNPYPVYYQINRPGYSYKHYHQYYPYSRGSVRYSDDDWYFSLGFKF